MKTYVKPDVYYEDFELSTHVATCAFDLNSQDETNCYAEGDTDDFPGLKIFMNENICNPAIDDGDYSGIIEDYCYTNGTTGNNVFNS